MEKLYAFSASGTMLYFSGTIPEDMFDVVERIANEVVGNESTEEYIQKLINNVFCELEITLSYCPIQYVFRVRRKDGYHAD